jgi:hypothetical protein
MVTVYLAGPIRGLAYDSAIGWRQDVEAKLDDVGIKCLSPMRNKELIKTVDKILDSYENMNGYSSKDIFNRDKFDIINSDILLFNFLNRKVSIIGSLFELAWGHLLNKYCIVVVNKDSIYAKHPFVKESACIMFENLDEAVDYIAKLYGGKYGKAEEESRKLGRRGTF